MNIILRCLFDVFYFNTYVDQAKYGQSLRFRLEKIRVKYTCTTLHKWISEAKQLKESYNIISMLENHRIRAQEPRLTETLTNLGLERDVGFPKSAI